MLPCCYETFTLDRHHKSMLSNSIFWAGRLKVALSNASAGHLPLVSRRTFWTVLVNTNTAEVLAFVPLDPF